MRTRPSAGLPLSVGAMWRYLLPYRGALAVSACVMVARAGVLLLVPWPLKFIIDSVLFSKPLPTALTALLPGIEIHSLQLLNLLAGAMFLLGAADALLAYLGDRLLQQTGQRAVFDVRRDLFAHLQALPLSFHRGQKTGDLLSRLGGDIQTLQDFVISAGSGVFAHLITVFGMAAVMLAIDWRYGLMVLSIAPILYFVARRFTAGIRGALRLAREKEGSLWGMAQETIASIQLVQAYGLERSENAKFAAQAGGNLAASLAAADLQARFAPVLAAIMAVSTGLIVWYGAYQALSGRVTAGELLVFLAYLRGMATPVRQFAKMARMAGKATVAAERLLDVFAVRPDIVDPPQPVVLSHCTGSFEYRGVGFEYRPGKPVLRDISFRVEAGETVALVGATGSGKSTLAGLLLRFHDPSVGGVLLDGQDIRSLSLAFLRSQIAVVLQDSLMFNAPLWQNIACGRDGAGRNDAVDAAMAAGVHDLFQHLPDGYDTLVGEKGATLSGGQRQCVAIARAMLRDAPIVILDEPTSSLDAFVEKRVMEALRRLTRGRTTLIIAHRLSTVAGADLILVLDHGRIVQSGTHDTLLSAAGTYLDLWRCGEPDAAAVDRGPRHYYLGGILK